MVGEEVRENNLPGAQACFIFDSKDAQYGGLSVCRAAVEVSGPESIHGAQKIGLIYRIYAKTNEARQKLIEKGLTINNTHVSVLHTNPFTSRGAGEKQTVRVIVRDIPWSVSSKEIVTQLEKLGAVPRSKLFNEHYRETEGPDKGKLTSFLTGQRFLYIDIPTKPLPRSFQVSNFTGRLYHFGQQKKTDVSETKTSHGEGEANVWETNTTKTQSLSQKDHDKEREKEEQQRRIQTENNNDCEAAGEGDPQQNEKDMETGDEKTKRQANIKSFLDRSRQMTRGRTGSLDSYRPRSGSKRRGTDKERERLPKSKSRRTNNRSPSGDREGQGGVEIEHRVGGQDKLADFFAKIQAETEDYDE